jgi:hypothetical protein
MVIRHHHPPFIKAVRDILVTQAVSLVRVELPVKRSQANSVRYYSLAGAVAPARRGAGRG